MSARGFQKKALREAERAISGEPRVASLSLDFGLSTQPSVRNAVVAEVTDWMEKHGYRLTGSNMTPSGFGQRASASLAFERVASAGPLAKHEIAKLIDLLDRFRQQHGDVEGLAALRSSVLSAFEHDELPR